MIDLIKNDSIYYYYNNSINKNIACFDLDYTLIKPKSGKKFPKDKDDWILLFPNIINYLKSLIKLNYDIIIFTNQKGISKNKTTIEDFNYKINMIKKQLDIDFSIFISTIDDKYRKPMTGMFDFYKTFNNNIDYKKSFYVGDAGGRIYKNKKDHSNDDRYFAFNIGLKYVTPEYFFDIKDDEYKLNEFNLELRDKNINLEKKEKHLIILVGPPACGKSYLSKNYFSDYEHINQDTLKSLKKCILKTESYMKMNKNVIIDNTNYKKATREHYINLSKKYDYNVDIIFFNLSKNECNYMNKYRTQTQNIKLIPDVVYHTYNKYLDEPDEDNVIIYDNNYVNNKYKF